MAGQTINVSILADTKQFSKAMKSLSAETGLDKLGGAAKRAGKVVAGLAATVAGVGGAIGALALKGGFERALNIEDARAQLKGLGHDVGTIDQVMNDALASVKGTAFGLGEAATLAGSAVAAGIKPGKELESQLRLVADAAALTKTDINEMGSIFTKVWTSGRVGTEELNQLADRGIPIWTALADAYGVSADELRKMVSSGKVDAETFATVMEETVGGAALAMGDTTRGAFKNMMAALSRAGESFLKGVFPSFKTGLDGITSLLDDIAPYAEAAGEAFGAWIRDVAIPAIEDLLPKIRDWLVQTRDHLQPVLQDMATTWSEEILPALQGAGDYISNTIVPALQDLRTWIEENRTVIEPVIAALLGFVTALAGLQKVVAIVAAVKGAVAAIAALATPVGLVVGAIGAVVGALAWFFTQTETGQAIWDSAWESMKQAAASVSDWLTNTAAPAIAAAWEVIKQAASDTATWVGENVGPVMAAGLEVVTAIIGEIQEAFDGLVAALSLVDWAAVWSGLAPALSAEWATVVAVVEGGLAVLAGVLSAGASAIEGDWATVWAKLSATADGAMSSAKKIVDARTRAIATAMALAIRGIQSAWESGWAAVQTAVAFYLAIVVSIVRSRIDRAVDAVAELPGKALAALGDLGNYLYNAGAQLISGFINGIRDSIPNVETVLRGLTRTLPSWKGPASLDRTILRASGRLVIDGFIAGMESRYDAVRASLNTLTDSLAGAAPTPALATAGPTGAPRAAETAPRGGGDRELVDYLVAELTANLLGGLTGLQKRHSRDMVDANRARGW